MDTIPTYFHAPKDLRDRLEELRLKRGWTLRYALIQVLKKGLEAEPI